MRPTRTTQGFAARHATYFAGVVDEACASTRSGRSRRRGSQALARDHANLRAALEFTLERAG